jgi:hypothetical protein
LGRLNGVVQIRLLLRQNVIQIHLLAMKASANEADGNGCSRRP